MQNANIIISVNKAHGIHGNSFCFMFLPFKKVINKTICLECKFTNRLSTERCVGNFTDDETIVIVLKPFRLAYDECQVCNEMFLNEKYIDLTFSSSSIIEPNELYQTISSLDHSHYSTFGKLYSYNAFTIMIIMRRCIMVNSSAY